NHFLLSCEVEPQVLGHRPAQRQRIRRQTHMSVTALVLPNLTEPTFLRQSAALESGREPDLNIRQPQIPRDHPHRTKVTTPMMLRIHPQLDIRRALVKSKDLA